MPPCRSKATPGTRVPANTALIARYTAIVLKQPSASFPLERLAELYRQRDGNLDKLIEAFEHRTGCGVLVNTSFNVRGEPIVCTPEDAYRCFMRTEMDYLVMGDYLFKKEEQPHYADRDYWQQKYELD